MGEVHDLIREKGRQQALQSEHARSVVEAAAAYLATEDSEIRFLYSGWCQAALPHKRLADEAVWQIRTDHITLLVQPGHKSLPTGDPVPVGVPYGSRARLILLYLQSEALRTLSREIELGRSMNMWLQRMGIPVGGKSMRDVRDQAERISRCRMTFQIQQGIRRGLVNQSILDTSMFVADDADGAQGTLLLETARLSETFYEQLKRHPVPVDEAAIKGLANNSMALDIYCWLAYRLHCLQEPKNVTWKALHGQFGRSVARLDHFRAYFKVNLELNRVQFGNRSFISVITSVVLERHRLIANARDHGFQTGRGLAMAVYPDARVESFPEGLTMMPSRPPVAPKLVSMSGSRPR
jgi:Plasmid encoded RepA protein